MACQPHCPSLKSFSEAFDASETVKCKSVTPNYQRNTVDVISTCREVKKGGVWKESFSKLTQLSGSMRVNRGEKKVKDSVDSHGSRLTHTRSNLFKPMAGTNGKSGTDKLNMLGGNFGSRFSKPLTGPGRVSLSVLLKRRGETSGRVGFGVSKSLSGPKWTGGTGMPAIQPIRMDVNPFYKGFEPAKLLADMKRKSSYVHTQKDFPGMNIPVPTSEPSSPVDTFPLNVVQALEDVTEEVRVEASTSRDTELVQTPPIKELAVLGRETHPASATMNKLNNRWGSCNYTSNLSDGSEVYVSYIWGPHTYQIFAMNDNKSILQLQDEIQKYACMAKKLSRTPEVDEVLLGLHGDDYCRGRVIEVKEDKVKLLFLDVGGCDDNDINILVEPTREIMAYPIYSATVTLAHVSSAPHTKKIQRKISPFVFGPLKVEFLDELVIGPGKQEFLSQLWISAPDHFSDIIQHSLNSLMK